MSPFQNFVRFGAKCLVAKCPWCRVSLPYSQVRSGWPSNCVRLVSHKESAVVGRCCLIQSWDWWFVIMPLLGFFTFTVIGLTFRLTAAQIDHDLVSSFGCVLVPFTGLWLRAFNTWRPRERSPLYFSSSRYWISDMLFRFKMCIVFLGSEIFRQCHA